MLKVENNNNFGICSKVYDEFDSPLLKLELSVTLSVKQLQNEKEIKICISGWRK